MLYDWPGNVRELVNVLERAQVLADGDMITLADLPAAVAAAGAAPRAVETVPYNLKAMERRLLHEVLRHTRGNKTAAAQALGVSPRTLYRMIERFGVTNLLALRRPASPCDRLPLIYCIRPAHEFAAEHTETAISRSGIYTETLWPCHKRHRRVILAESADR